MKSDEYRLKKIKIWYWYFVLVYTLPFLFSFMMLMNPSSEVWHINGIVCLIILVLFVDWLSFLILLTLGVVFGVLFYASIKIDRGSFISHELLSVLVYSYLGPIIYIVLFSRKRNISHQAKIQTMKMLAGSIAHELRTPLSAMMMDAGFLSKLLPHYQDAYSKAREAGLPIHEISFHEEKGMMATPNNLETVSRNAHTMITMLLTNLNEGRAGHKGELCSMKRCVAEALKTYPFSAYERTLLHWEEDVDDFSFFGNKELIKHVVYNLLKNALYAIASVGKGEIFITIEPGTIGTGKNRLIFKDTGSGISASNLRHIFDRFYTKTEHGTGIGLAFCQSVIQGFGGEITCTSQEGEHTTFTITLPVLDEAV